jgi:hypothetical protein
MESFRKLGFQDGAAGCMPPSGFAHTAGEDSVALAIVSIHQQEPVLIETGGNASIAADLSFTLLDADTFVEDPGAELP